ncbi:M4 family metallopeptidase [Luteipulveratus sp. YIM 133132]|uniref:Neutral metalloproteinase n=1 Tax=Luteipulveratus flavus TaxID=3031728 RepID=A0ABT6C7P8_9MICO|nr:MULTISPECIES: M4 family metallopeptidase [unclassified Luteipulveratus]MDE9365771.1 M4 family metallopeptidase [Luteipulveratus sp. YIM 133132]MDF8264961.1 M4 family metallopeptidase [Luteipulveratus sp. YIM 133296]
MRKKHIALTGTALLACGSLAGAPAFANGGDDAAPSNQAAVASYLKSDAAAVKGAAGDSYVLVGTSTAKDGSSHARYHRTYRGLPVVGGDFVVHSKGGKVTGQSVAQQAPISVSTTAKVAKGTARTNAAAGARSFNVDGATDPMLVVDARGAKPVLAWMTVVTGVQSDGLTPSRKAVLVDAQSGKTIRSSETVKTLMSGATSKAAMARKGVHHAATLTTKAPANLRTVAWDAVDPSGTTRATTRDASRPKATAGAEGTGKSLFLGDVKISTTQDGSSYTLTDPDRGGNSACDMNNSESGSCDPFTDADNAWGSGSNDDRATAAVDVYYGAATTWDYYKDAYGRNGIFDDGKGVPSRVHYGSSYVNAFWDGQQMTYGDGEGDNAPLVAIDVAGHEMSHGVAEALANLGYEGDVGGINEANSDVNGTMVEFKANSAVDKPDFLIGEEIDINGDGSPLRYMDKPSKDGASHDCWSSSTANDDPHYTSGVGNHAFFLLANGSGQSEWGTSETCDSSSVTGIGADKAAKIWYTAIKDYGTSDMTYADLHAGMVKAADAEFGAGSTESKAVDAAWKAVSVG